jgi:hypothetical protein
MKEWVTNVYHAIALANGASYMLDLLKVKDDMLLEKIKQDDLKQLQLRW